MNVQAYKEAHSLLTADWLAQNLNDPDLRIFDCTFHLVHEEGTGRPYRQVSGRQDYESGHIPGADHLDLQEDFSVPDAPHLFTLPSPEHVATAFARAGVDDGKRVVLYSSKSMQCATRFWWMLRWLGFDNAAILDGGMDKWLLDGRALSTGPGTYPPGNLTVRLRPELFVGKGAVQSELGNSTSCIINALEPDLHSGETLRYARAGRLPGSINVSATDLHSRDTKEFVDPETAAQAFATAGAKHSQRIITYCGGGIKATLNGFILHQLGYPNIAVYDGSMSEWASDNTLPMEKD
jgi:thiosulfate/3-mercaptopyruvate sulfurtransferase